ncbi:hypothetical protein CLV51_101930 [Chitinophaga niastensis]|uniref:Uncharacterized protein n=1 Tax=Chitinophaga niastensis TaxID=536980 RepID=A0A2P8HTP6_CHINA|nr:hypothetical protein CLV51_101930 [Chitinophaga niastensis]
MRNVFPYMQANHTRLVNRKTYSDESYPYEA